MAGKVWRIGLMGHACNSRNVLMYLNALNGVFTHLNAPVERRVAVAASQKVLLPDQTIQMSQKNGPLTAHFYCMNALNPG